MVTSNEKTLSAAADDGCKSTTFLTAEDQAGSFAALYFHHGQVSARVSNLSGMLATLTRYAGSSSFKDWIMWSSLRNAQLL